MAQDEDDLLQLLKFERNGLEDSGYERYPHRAWRAALTRRPDANQSAFLGEYKQRFQMSERLAA